MPKLATRLHDSQLRALKPTDRRQPLCDGDRLWFVLGPGKPGGHQPSRTWEYRYVSPVTGKASSVKLGSFPTMGVSEARRARDEQAALVARGLDPAIERRRERSAERVTLASTARAWDEARRGTVDDYTRKLAMERLERYVVQRLGARPLASLTTPDLREVLDVIVKAGKIETAKRTRAVLSQVFDWAIARGDVTTNPAYPLRRAYMAPPVRGHVAILDPVAFGGLLRALDGYSGQAVTRAALRLMPLVFVRSSELREAIWTEFDLDAATWTIPARRMKVKGNGDHVVPLSTQAVALLRELHDLTGHGARVFPGLRPGKFLSEGTLNAALTVLGYKGAHSVHGFRSSASTILNDVAASEGGQRFDAEHIEAQLAHRKADKIRGAYARTTFLDQRIAMMQAWADECDRLRALASSKAAA